MRILAIESATADCSVALRIGDRHLQASATAATAKPSEQLPGLVARLLAEAGVGLRSLDVVAYDHGPGAFTGIRIGCGLAQGLALGADLPLLGICSLRVLAMQAPQGRVLAALDARMAEVYWAVFERGTLAELPTARALSEARVEPPQGWTCPAGVAHALGDGFGVALETAVDAAGTAAQRHRLASRVPDTVRLLDDTARPRAIEMLPLAAADLAAGLAMPPEAASPLYVRDKVALTAAEQLARRAGR